VYVRAIGGKSLLRFSTEEGENAVQKMKKQTS